SQVTPANRFGAVSQRGCAKPPTPIARSPSRATNRACTHARPGFAKSCRVITGSTARSGCADVYTSLQNVASSSVAGSNASATLATSLQPPGSLRVALNGDEQAQPERDGEDADDERGPDLRPERREVRAVHERGAHAADHVRRGRDRRQDLHPARQH